ncbi:TIGR01777 family oxidoreductase [Gaoshiqia sediminis]|uniref:TIGR01777 family oxidoreductase n=1 Tax=Gaoshiqia sediminis TaxID=2986998 RepID=A0AA41YD37_9BACT|nr:TIGR01777 family oxidoreductase [Gaoshiqia sediminis]MCW0484345.1 TIGR01777 family oxidoreductase [Gaoshiqia sediminis]
MKIAITGANGYIGQELIYILKERGHKIFALNRQQLYGQPETLAASLENTDAVINLAGAPILQRWTKFNQSVIYNSRVVTTRNLTQAINLLAPGNRPRIFVSASAVGIYQTGQSHDDSSSKFDPGFLGKLVTDWEKASDELPVDVRKVTFRIGVVLGRESHTIKKMLPLFKLGLGGKLGNGQQPFPFIHIHDLVLAFYQSLEDETFTGIYNLVAPDQTTNQRFTQLLAKKLKGPAFFKVPCFMLKLIYGRASEIILKGQRVIPNRLLSKGFMFQYPDISACIEEILQLNGSKSS